MANQRLEAFINDCARVRAAIIKHLIAIHTTKQALKAEHAEIKDKRIGPALEKLRTARQALKGTVKDLSGFADLNGLDGTSIPRDESTQDGGDEEAEPMGVRILVDEAAELIDEARELFRGRSPSSRS
ncbi:MAG: hypothetical protein Q9208_001580 [Pyrenodesmia sp. 3 TL-2023]